MGLSIFCELFWYDINRKKGYSSLREKILGWGGKDQRFDNRRDGLKYLHQQSSSDQKISVRHVEQFENNFEFHCLHGCSPLHSMISLISPRDLNGPILDLDFRGRLRITALIIST